MRTPQQAVELLMERHDAITIELIGDLENINQTLATMRKNAKGRDVVERRLLMAEEKLAKHQAKRVRLEKLSANAEELATIQAEIARLTNKRRSLAGDELLSTLFANAIAGLPI